MKICIIRHGETDWNVAKKLQGRKDIPLNGNGKKQAESCGLLLNDRSWKAIFTSPLLRARQTSEIVANVLNIKSIIEEPDLIERDYGKATGLTYYEYSSNRYDIENTELLKNRMYNVLKKIANEYYPDNIIVVSHGSAINALLLFLLSFFNRDEKIELKNACISMLEYENEKFCIDFINKNVEDFEENK